MLTGFVVVFGALVLGYLLLRSNALWIYRFFDRARRNDRGSLPPAYELPRYYRLTREGDIDYASRWPGWDGWYFVMIPEDQDVPVKMVRASLMTGLYGLDGIDNYDKLRGLSPFDAVEYLTLTPTEEVLEPGRVKENRFWQHYLPKAATLSMQKAALDVSIAGTPGKGGPGTGEYGRINGAWPHYEFEFHNPETGLDLSLRYKAENIIWWADLPGLFTYFAAFGTFAGEMTYRGKAGREESYPLQGKGSFEHGFARKPCNFDSLWSPVRLLKGFFPTLRPVRYHYELLLGDDHHRGGFMHVRAFGIDWRNRGGLYLDGSYQEIHRLRIDYLDDPEPDVVPGQPGEPPVTFYRSWHVTAETSQGLLEYRGWRDWPPAPIARHMTYYHFSYAGTYRGEKLSGRGYGEYVHL